MDYAQNPSLFMSYSLRCTLFTKKAKRLKKQLDEYAPLNDIAHWVFVFFFPSLIANNVVIVNLSGSKG